MFIERKRCFKKCHNTRKQAKTELKRLNRVHGTYHAGHAYYCDQCEAWHNTSWSKAKYQGIKKQIDKVYGVMGKAKESRMSTTSTIPEKIANAWVLKVSTIGTPLFGYESIRLELHIQKNQKACKEEVKSACDRAIEEYFNKNSI